MGERRTVHLSLVTPTGQVLGTLPPLPVELAWENDTAPVVAAAREAYGVDVTVLRMRWVEGFEAGGPIGYLAECASAPEGVPLTAADPEPDEPLRVPWARPGGPLRTLRWADQVLDGLGRPRTGPAVQTRSWGLSGIWRLPTAAGAAWLKQVPGFFAHEGAVIGWLARNAPGLGPTALGVDADRVLLEDIPGGELWEPPTAVRQESLAALLRMQTTALDHLDELLALGVPDRRPAALTARLAATVAALTARLAATVAGWAGRLDPAEASALGDLAGRLPALLAEVEGCGVPDTLVHGDFHPGNVLHGGTGQTIIDWGDTLIGHPALDLAAFLIQLPEEDRAPLTRQWADHWRATAPGCQPERAAELMRPVAALGQASVYDMFARCTEPGERIWHAKYVLRWLRRTAAAASGQPAPVFS